MFLGELIVAKKMESKSSTDLSTVPVPNLNFVESATADNTRIAYRADIRHFQKWGGQLPCDPETLVRYLEHFAGTLNSRTLQRRLVAIRQFHRYLGFNDPGTHPLVEKTLRGIQNTFGKPRKQAPALNVNELEHLLNLVAEDDSLAAARDHAMISLGFAAGLRGGELIRLRWQDCVANQEGLLITIPRSKTDPTGEGLSTAIPRLDSIICPCYALANWKIRQRQANENRESTGTIFLGINRWQQLTKKAITIQGLNYRIRHWAEQAGLEQPERYSSHSLRRGMATSASAAGASFQSIMRQGRWRHEGTVMQYIEAGQQFQDNAFAHLIKAHEK